MKKTHRPGIWYKNYVYRSLTALGTVLLSVNSGQAQESVVTSGLQEIVVTAQRRSESIQNVPISITAVGSEMIERSKMEGIEDYFSVTPNVSFQSNGSRDRKEPSIRGISNRLDPYGEIRPAAFALYIDDFNVVAGTSNPEVLDLDRIEILRGPQGTYFGRNAVGGAINIVTKAPDFTPYMKVGVGYGKYDTKHAEAILNLPVVDDILAIRAAGQIDKSDGHIKNINPIGGGNDSNYKTGRLTARLTPNDRFTWDVTGNYSKEVVGMREGVPSGQLTNFPRSVYYGGAANPIVDGDGVGFYPNNRNRVNFDRPQSVGTEFYYISSKANYEFDNMVFTAVGGFLRTKIFNFGDVDGSSRDFFHENFDLTRKSRSLELRLQSSGENRLDWIIGTIAGRDSGVTAQQTLSGVDNPQGNPVDFEVSANDYDSATKYQALFGELRFHATDKLDVITGLRYSRDNVRRKFQTRASNIILQDDERQKKFDDFSPRFTISYKPEDDMTAYVTVSKGYKSGGVQNNISIPEQFYKSESLWNYELGFKADAFDRRLRFSTAVFYMDWKNVQEQYSFIYSDAAGVLRRVSGTSNAASARSYGAEISLDAMPIDSVRLGFQAGYLNAKYKDYPDAFVDLVTIDVSGETMPNAPKWTFGGQAEYGVPVTEEFEGYIRAEWSYKSQTLGGIHAYRYPGFPFTAPGFHNVNLRVGLESEKISASAYIENLFNANYYVNAYEKAFYSGVHVQPSYQMFGIRLSYKIF